MKQPTQQLDKGAEDLDNKIQKINTPLPGKTAKLEIDNAIRKEWKRKWQNALHYKHTKHFYSGPDKNMAKKILNISRSHLTCLLYTSPSPRDRQKSRMPSSA